MKLPPFIFFETSTLPGAGFVLQNDQPFYVGKIWLFYSADRLQQFRNEYTDWNIVTVPGYRIAITYYANMMNVYNPPKGPVKEALKQMALFYYKEKVQPFAKAFERYKIA